MGVYLDWNATTPLRAQSRSALLAACEDSWANPASIHAWGQQARHSLDQSRLAIARTLGCKAHELVFTSGGTEANALAIASALQAGGDAVVSAIDHSSVLRNAAHHCQRHGGTLHAIGVNSEGMIDRAQLMQALSERTALVSLQYANNEIGVIQEVSALSALVRAQSAGAVILSDCCQAIGKTAFSLSELGVDLATFAGHKFGAPKGIGLLQVRQGVRLSALQHGGRQQQDRRSGTEDAAMVAAFTAALTESCAQLEHELPRQRALLDRLWSRIQQALPLSGWLARSATRIANTMSLAHPGCRREDLVARLDLKGFGVSPGAACMAGRGEPSHVVHALGLGESLERSAIRISIGWTTSDADIDAFAEAYIREVMSITGPR